MQFFSEFLGPVNLSFPTHPNFQECKTCGWPWITVQKTDAKRMQATE